jgi:hypothetical protein
MPRRLTQTTSQTHQTLKNVSFESQVVTWLMQDGWQVFLPMLDHGHKTDILISDGPNYYRVQVKTIEASGEDHEILNSWESSNVDCIVWFARNSTWGYVTKAFEEKRRKLSHESHQRFNQNKNDFLKAFHKL